MLVLRFRSKDGMFRISANPSDDFVIVLEELLGKLDSADPQSIKISNNANGSEARSANSLCGNTVEQLGLKNGDMLFVKYESLAKANELTVAFSVSGKSTETVKIVPVSTTVTQLPVDDLLSKSDGLIKRGTSTYCKHGDKGMCEYCSPLPPWDATYQKEHSIKHMSFHARLKELNQQRNNKHSGLSYIAPLDEPNFNIDLTCHQGHHPYPKGICSKCQPSPITLQSQKFRMVDHVEYADSSILNKFIDSWRNSGTQRFGILYGSYEPFDKVPLGIKAMVEAVYEPPQLGEADGLSILSDEEEQATVDEIANSLGLYQVGVVFTDLTDSGKKDGSVLCKRHKETYFLSNLEILMAARSQISHPNKTTFSNSGNYLSKYITSVVSGGLKGEIEPKSYQVSVDAESLVRADILTGSTQPSQLYINENNDRRYVPDISYLQLNEYNLQVKTTAKPTLPVDFLLVSLTDSFPLEPKPFFTTPKPFTIENRGFMGESQDLDHLKKHLLGGESNGDILIDFHLIFALKKMSVLSPQEFGLLLSFAKSKDYTDYLHLIESPGWMTLLTILEHS